MPPAAPGGLDAGTSDGISTCNRATNHDRPAAVAFLGATSFRTLEPASGTGNTALTTSTRSAMFPASLRSRVLDTGLLGVVLAVCACAGGVPPVGAAAMATPIADLRPNPSVRR